MEACIGSTQGSGPYSNASTLSASHLSFGAPEFRGKDGPLVFVFLPSEHAWISFPLFADRVNDEHMNKAGHRAAFQFGGELVIAVNVLTEPNGQQLFLEFAHNSQHTERFFN